VVDIRLEADRDTIRLRVENREFSTSSVAPRGDPEPLHQHGFQPGMKEATTLAVRDMTNFLAEQKHLSHDDAWMLTSVAIDVDITQLVDGNVGVHAMCPKIIFVK
jgi:acetamidase/formamidase